MYANGLFKQLQKERGREGEQEREIEREMSPISPAAGWQNEDLLTNNNSS